MKTKNITTSFLISTLICVIFSTSSFAGSGYDSLVKDISTSAMVNNVADSKGKTCGSPNDDYAKSWRYAFRRQQYNDRAYHSAAVKSLETAINSPDGAYLVAYNQATDKNGHRSPYLFTVYWTEHDKSSFETRFIDIKNNGVSEPVLIVRAKEGSSKQLHSAVVASPSVVQGGTVCMPEFLWGYTSDKNTRYTSFIKGSANRLFVSTFDVIYPEGYEGRPVPNQDPADNWRPTSSHYDNLMGKITINKLINYIDNFYGKTCGSPTFDYSNSWFNVVNRQGYWHRRSYHESYMKSLQKAMATGAYAIGYNQQNNHDNTSGTYFITVYWTESRADFSMRFLQEYPDRRLSIVRNKNAQGKLYVAVVGSPALIQKIEGCEVRFLWGNNTNEGYASPYFQEGDRNKLYKSTFDIEYPDGYKGSPVPGSLTKLDYLALGDSFSSGEGDTEKNGVTNQKYYRQFTDVKEDKSKGVPQEKCHISTRSYPYKLAQYMGLSQSGIKQWDTVACSGATIYDMNWDNSGGYEGQDSPLGRLHGLDNKDTLKGAALNEMIPGRVKQIEFVKKYQPKVITLTAGGNDVDFGGKIKSCIDPRVSIGTCDWAKDEMGTLGSQIRGQFDRLVDLYEELKTASPGSKIYAIGYPQFTTDAEPASCGLNAGTIDLDERKMIVRATQYMNEVIEAAARKTGVKYVNISNALNGGKICERYQIYMTGIVGLGEQESYHPNRSGHTRIFVEIARQLNHEDLLTYSKYPTAGDESVNAPSSIYFDKGIPSSINTKMLANARPAKGSDQKIALAQGSLQPNSSARVEIRSNPVDLGSYSVSNDGSLQETITIPEHIPAGYHTLFIYGKSKDGEDIKITQTLLVTGKDQDDLDDNGIKDKNQPCGAFIQAANKDEDLDGIDDACDPEVTEPVLYSARNGLSKLGEDENRIYLFRNTRASSLTGVTNDYVDKSRNKDNTDALVGYTISEEARGLSFEKMIVMKEGDVDNDIAKNTPIILAKNIEQKCYALKSEDHLSPALKPGSNEYTPRGLIKLSNLPKGVSCEE